METQSGATITAVGTLLGVAVKIMSDEYNKKLEESRRLNGQD